MSIFDLLSRPVGTRGEGSRSNSNDSTRDMYTDDSFYAIKRAVSNMAEVRHRDCMTYNANGFWDLSKPEKKRRSVDDADVDELHRLHQSKRACRKHQREVEGAVVAVEQAAYDTELSAFNRAQEEAPKFFLYRLTQDVNKGYETCYEALVVAACEEEAKLIHPRTLRRGWWAEKTHSQNAIEWNTYNPGQPMPAWYLGDVRDWVHPGFVQATLISSYDGESGARNTCIMNCYSGC